jgi:hypothetical protein
VSYNRRIIAQATGLAIRDRQPDHRDALDPLGPPLRP